MPISGRARRHSLLESAIIIFYTRGEHKKLLFTTLNLTTLYCSAAVPNKKLLQMQLIFWSVLVFCAYHCHAKTSQKTMARQSQYLSANIFLSQKFSVQQHLAAIYGFFISISKMFQCFILDFNSNGFFKRENTSFLHFSKVVPFKTCTRISSWCIASLHSPIT